MRTREELPGRSPIAPGQARLTLEFLRDGLSEKKLQLVDTSILLILLSPEPGVTSELLEEDIAKCHGSLNVLSIFLIWNFLYMSVVKQRHVAEDTLFADCTTGCRVIHTAVYNDLS